MEPGTTLSTPRICSEMRNPTSARRAQGRAKPRKTKVRDERGRDLPSHQEMSLVLRAGPGPSLAASLSFPPAAQPRPGHGQTHSTSHTMAVFSQGHPGEATVSHCPLSPWGRQQAGRNSSSPELVHSPPCLLAGILSKV